MGGGTESGHIKMNASELRNAIKSGAVGVDMGRNIFQSRYPVAMMKAVNSVVHEGFKSETAFELFNDESSD